MMALLDTSIQPAPAWLPDGLRPLGPVDHGSRGASVRALDVADGAIVVARLFAEPDAAERQAALLAQLRGASAPRLRGRAGRVLILGFLDGETLEQRLGRAGGKLPPDALCPILIALAAAVETVHQAGVIHRDLKPGNVLLCPDGCVRLLDFEAALQPGEDSSREASSLLTPGYAAPEQYWADGLQGPWTDVYALGAIAFRGLTGAPPPPAPERAAGQSDLDGAAVPAALHHLLHRALALDPRARTGNAMQFRRELLGGGEGLPPAGNAGADSAVEDGPPTLRVVRDSAESRPPPRGPGRSSTPRTGRRRAGRRILAVVLMLTAVASLGGWLGRPWYERNIKREWLIDPAGGGDSSTITDAIARSGEGAELRIRPGVYRESLLLQRAIILAAADSADPPVVSPPAGPCLAVTGDGVVVRGLDLRAPSMVEGVVPEACVSVTGGNPHFEENRITGDGAPAVVLRDGARGTLHGNVIRSSAAGVVVNAGARAAIEENMLSAIVGPALLVRGGAAPLVEGNVFEASGAVVFGEGATGIFRNNAVRSSRAAAIEVGGGADPEIAGNSIEKPGQAAVYVYGDGRGRVHDNRLEGSKLSGIVVEGGAPLLTGNQITASGEHGILVIAASGGEISENVVRNSRLNGIAIGADARIGLGSNTLQGNAVPQLVDLRQR